MEQLELLASKITEDEADIHQSIKLMTLKARIYEEAGIPQKGFSVALRAASCAHRAKLLPALWEAVAMVCAVLNSFAEFNASVKMLESIIPQVLECEVCELMARSFSLLADAHMGLAGHVSADNIRRKEHLTKASENLDRAFDNFLRIEDIRGQREMMAKKATIMHLNGDRVLANDCAARYLDIRATAMNR